MSVSLDGAPAFGRTAVRRGRARIGPPNAAAPLSTCAFKILMVSSEDGNGFMGGTSGEW